ncbi:SH3 domain-containing protein [Paracoccus liaowanqingii]|uniref:SH3 domain-containing protein n=1 Tax=Paracoccus liaowanqingii TaxID=2560053 RepID=A0A4V1BIX9_9RHOB|nr:SH3 domain-containing protein [Paracoccus liaowanqingii]QBX34352.1 SH3 domain-containing protein [Paracoccus liaowanqingii]
MRSMTPLACLLSNAVLAVVLAGASLAQTMRSETVAPSAAAAGTVIESGLRGVDSIDYLVAGDAGQILSVDLATPNSSLSFNIRPEGSEDALFIGSISGNVADIPLPESGTYVARVYLMGNAARRDETAAFSLGIGLGGPDFADGLAGGPDWWAVSISPGSALNIRSGPATRHDVVGRAQNGQVMQNRGCRMTGSERWCRIRTHGSGVQGWVSGQFLIETEPPTMPDAPDGGPVGNGTPFDATGMVPCAATAGTSMRSCPFGVVRQGPGSAGVWIAFDGGGERQILFEGGTPVATNLDAKLTSERSGDVTLVRIGEERYEIPDALENGG